MTASTETSQIPSIDTLLGTPYLDGLGEMFDGAILTSGKDETALISACRKMLQRDKGLQHADEATLDRLAHRIAYITEGAYFAGEQAATDPRLLLGMDVGGSILPGMLFSHSGGDDAMNWHPVPSGVTMEPSANGRNPLFLEPTPVATFDDDETIYPEGEGKTP
jgi:hypothetical protein